MFIQLIRSDEEGQFAPTLSLEIRNFSIHGFSLDTLGVIFDITHMDGERERMLLGGNTHPFEPMVVGEQKLVQNLTIVPFPTSGETLSKEEWREQVGVYMLHNKERGHFYKA